MIYHTGILRDKTMADELMYISNDDNQNYLQEYKIWPQLDCNQPNKIQEKPLKFLSFLIKNVVTKLWVPV